MPVYECPNCGRRVPCRQKEDVPYRPFCSYRCKMVDLGKWLNEEYTVSEEIMPEMDFPEDTDRQVRE